MVIEFHSPMFRMNKTLPDAVEGESEPKVDSWRAYHGPTASRNRPTDPASAAHGIARRIGRSVQPAGRRSSRQRRHRS